MTTKQWDYWNGPDLVDRRVAFAKEFRPEYQANGDELQRRFGAAIDYTVAQNGLLLPEGWASGWRPGAVNEATSNAARLSTHLVANGGDKRDDVNGSLCWAFFRDQHPLVTHGVYIEHPVATVVRSWQRALDEEKASKKPTPPHPWCHGQIVAPASHDRIYWPDSKSPGEWESFLALGGHPGIGWEAWKELAVAAASARAPRKPRPGA